MFCKIKNRDYLCTALRKESQFFVLMNVANAKIAQLVEHNLAKVGVAGSSPVFRSSVKKFAFVAQMVELVDTLL